MPKNLSNEDVNFGNVVYQWTVKEYEKYEKGRRWYIIAGVIVVALLAYAILSGNYIFALIIMLFGIILFLQEMQEPAEVPFAITETGIIIGSRYYPYKELTGFWMIYNPPMVKNLYFLNKSLITHRLQVPLLNNDPRPIRDYLNNFLEEDTDQEQEPFSDIFSRLFKLH